MSKLVNWGRWVAGATLVAWGLHELYLAPVEPGRFGYHLMGAVLFLLPGIGLVFWNRLAAGAAIGVCAFAVAQSFNGPFGPESPATRVAMGLSLGLIVLWLGLPEVRRRFRGDATA